jgi:hypothetical protein
LHIICFPSSCLFCHLVIWEFALSMQSPVSWRCVPRQYRTSRLYTNHALDSGGTGFDFFSWRPVILIKDFPDFTNSCSKMLTKYFKNSLGLLLFRYFRISHRHSYLISTLYEYILWRRGNINIHGSKWLLLCRYIC